MSENYEVYELRTGCAVAKDRDECSNCATLRARLAEVEGELAAEKAAHLLTYEAATDFSDMPCGHSSMWAYTEDGGKHIVCLLCIRDRATRAEARVVELEASLPAPLSHQMTCAKRDLLQKQMRSLMPIRGHTVDCAGCSKPTPVIHVRKCHWCGCWYCPVCSDAHFGANPDRVRRAALAECGEGK